MSTTLRHAGIVAAFALAATALPCTALAQATPAAASPHTFTGNVGLFSQYIFRGLTQTDEEPALQGGLDYSHASGFYVGTWGSNVSWLKENFSTPPNTIIGQYSRGGSLELDLYGGFKNTIGDTGFGYDVGALYYWYPGRVRSGCVIGTDRCPKANTLEGYAAVTWKWLTAKYSHSFGDTFGWPDADGTWYLDLSAAIPLGETGLTLGLHWGKQKYDGNVPGTNISYDSFLSYEDWRVSLAYDLSKVSTTFSGVEVGAMYTDTRKAHTCGYGGIGQATSHPNCAGFGPYPNNIADDQVTVWVKKTF